MKATTGEILKTLKTATNQWHTRIEAIVPVFSEAFALADYRGLLELFYGFYGNYDKTLAEVPRLGSVLPDWRERLKSPWLEEDLLWLRYSQADLPRLQAPYSTPRLDSVAAAFGALYVTEGSTLGGQIIGRHLENSLGLLPGKGATFFNGHGENTGMMWKTSPKRLTAWLRPRTSAG